MDALVKAAATMARGAAVSGDHLPPPLAVLSRVVQGSDWPPAPHGYVFGPPGFGVTAGDPSAYAILTLGAMIDETRMRPVESTLQFAPALFVTASIPEQSGSQSSPATYPSEGDAAAAELKVGPVAVEADGEKRASITRETQRLPARLTHEL